MKNHRFLWLRNRTTNNRKCEKARNIKEKRTIEMFNTVSKQLVEHLSSASDNFKLSYNEKIVKVQYVSLCTSCTIYMQLLTRCLQVAYTKNYKNNKTPALCRGFFILC